MRFIIKKNHFLDIKLVLYYLLKISHQLKKQCLKKKVVARNLKISLNYKYLTDGGLCPCVYKTNKEIYNKKREERNILTTEKSVPYTRPKRQNPSPTPTSLPLDLSPPATSYSYCFMTTTCPSADQQIVQAMVIPNLKDLANLMIDSIYPDTLALRGCHGLCHLSDCLLRNLGGSLPLKG